MNFTKVFRRARVYVADLRGRDCACDSSAKHLAVAARRASDLYGAWLMLVYGLTQHAGLAENVLDHRLNCRTVYMNPVNRFLYWNMNYHVEHHMFPLVPYHALAAAARSGEGRHAAAVSGLARLRGARSFRRCWRQVKDPAYHVKRKLPETQSGIAANPTSVRRRAGFARLAGSVRCRRSLNRADVSGSTIAGRHLR